MQSLRTLLAALAAMVAFAAGAGAGSAAERRLALVVGESAYAVKPLATAANDAGLVAQTLQAAGFDVTGARDLEEAALKQAFRDFLDKAAEAGPGAVVFVYVSGYGLQLEGENYLVPVDARLTRDADIPMRALRVSDYLKPLAASGARLNVVVLDVARASPFQLSGQPIAGGLSLYEPGGRTLLAYNAAPGTIAPEGTGDYGPYAHALAEMIRDGGAPLMEVFENTRLRVSDMTKGAQIPWNSQSVATDFFFFQREANAPARAVDASRLTQPIKALGPEAGFSAAIRRDTLAAYQDYVATYPAAPYAKRARAILAARREALTWRRSRVVDTPNAYWAYLRRYPKGPHAWDARRRLAELRYELEPPQSFQMIDYDDPPPPPEEMVYVDGPAVYFDDPAWALPPPPPPPVYLLPPPPPDFVVLPPPVVIAQPYVLPAPQYTPIPAWQRAPAYVAPPPDNFIYANAHNAVAVDPDGNNVVVRDRSGGVLSTGALTAVGAGAAVAIGAALPNFIAKKNAVAPANAAPPPMGATGPAAMPAPAMPVPAANPAQLGQPAQSLAPATGAQTAPPPPGLTQPAVAPSDEMRRQTVPPAGTLPQAQPASGRNHLPPQQPANATAPLAQPILPTGAQRRHELPTPRVGEGRLPVERSPEAGARIGRPEGGRPEQNPSVSESLVPHGPSGRQIPPGPRDHAPTAAHETGPAPHPAPLGGLREGLPAEGASPMGGERPGRAAPGVGPAGERGPSARHVPVDQGGAEPPHRPAAPRAIEGGAMPGSARAIERPEPRVGGPAGRQPPHDGPAIPRDPGPDRPQPRMREAPPLGMGSPMRGLPHEAMPGGAEPMQPPHMRAGPPPQMHAPAPDRGPPAGMMRPPAAQPAAPAMMRPAEPPPNAIRPSRVDAPHGGGHGGFGGMR